MRALLTISDALAKLTTGIGQAAAWLFIPLMFVISADVISRRFFTIGSIQLQELEWHLHAILFLMCLGYAYVANSHVRVELLREHYSPRLMALVELFALVFLVLPLFGILIKYSSDLVFRSYVSGERSPHAGGLEYRWMIKFAMPVGFTILALSAVSTVLRCLVLVFGSEELRQKASTSMLPADKMKTNSSEGH